MAVGTSTASTTSASSTLSAKTAHSSRVFLQRDAAFGAVFLCDWHRLLVQKVSVEHYSRYFIYYVVPSVRNAWVLREVAVAFVPLLTKLQTDRQKKIQRRHVELLDCEANDRLCDSLALDADIVHIVRLDEKCARRLHVLNVCLLVF